MKKHLTSPYGAVYTEATVTSPYGEVRLRVFGITPNGERMNDMITDAKEFGQELRKRRQELGYTQAYVSACSGFSVSFISDLENGKSTAELGRAIVLANLLGLDCSLTPRGRQSQPSW